jgi:hypothetical protein
LVDSGVNAPFSLNNFAEPNYLLIRDFSKPPLEMIYSVKQYEGFEETLWTLEKEEDVFWWLTNVMAHTPV